MALSIPEIATLLDVVPGVTPAGVDLRAPSGAGPSPIVRLRRLANEARSSDRRASETAPPGTTPAIAPAWEEVAELGRKILVEMSKDLEAAACLCEAWLRLFGLNGLQAGLQLVAGLVERHWNALHPMRTADAETDPRMELLRSLDTSDRGLPQRLHLTPVVGAGLPRALCLWELQQLDKIQTLPEAERAKALERSKLPSAEEMRGALEEEPEALLGARAEAAEALAAADTLTAALKRHGQSIPIPTLRGILADIDTRLVAFAARLPQRLPVEISDTGTEDGAVPDASVTANRDTRARGVFDREGALVRLSEISAQFRRTEPHSPVSYIIDQAVRWGRMPLPDLLTELLPKGEAREEVFRRAGLTRREG